MTWIKRLGYLYNIAKGSESIANQMAHLIVGVLSGLPDFAVSLRVSIAFYLGATLELPTGILADVLGHRRALVYGYITLSFASFCLFLACHDTHSSVTLPFLILSSISSAIGGGCVSGCLQAYIQDYIDSKVSQSGQQGQPLDEIRTKALVRAQAYGNLFSAYMPTLVLAATLANYYATGHSEWSLLIPVITYGALSLFFFVIGRRTGKSAPGRSFNAHCRKYGQRLVSFHLTLRRQSWRGQARFTILFLRMALSILTVIHVHTYLLVSQLRDIDLQHGTLRVLAAGLLVLAAFDLAHIPKGWLAPFITKRFRANQLIYFSLFSQIALALVALIGFNQGYTTSAVIGYALLFQCIFSPGHMTLQTCLLAEMPKHLRATAFSMVQTVVLIAYGSYSVHLVARGSGLDTPSRIITQLLVLAGIGVALAIVSGCLNATWRSDMPLDVTPR
ncbi:MFS transporter [Burkholderia sp. MS455]|uniref:MFS transporter n=1 Tax=Burkholderia sp. MS455 TaxID=2811788 RepID=UPI00195C1C11|nr:MFS transporter [Burkholderia sp. MS455]QRR07549.1 MFS transporter [Burkholderia sp. MS455]